MGFSVTLQVRPCKLGLGIPASHGQKNPFAMLISCILTELRFHVPINVNSTIGSNISCFCLIVVFKWVTNKFDSTYSHGIQGVNVFRNIATAGDCMDAGGRAKQEPEPRER